MAEPVATQPESCTLALPVLDIACQPLRDLVNVSKGSDTYFSGSKADMRLSICSWLVNTSRSSLFSAAMSSCGLQQRSWDLLCKLCCIYRTAGPGTEPTLEQLWLQACLSTAAQ